MTHRQRMLAAMRGEPVDRLPWAPRMDLWYIANREKGELPERMTGWNMVDLAGELGAACHAVRADFTRLRSPQQIMLSGFGLDLHYDYPFKVEVVGLPVEFHHGLSLGRYFRGRPGSENAFAPQTGRQTPPLVCVRIFLYPTRCLNSLTELISIPKTSAI